MSLDQPIVRMTMLASALACTACSSAPDPEKTVEVHILMTLDQFIAANGDAVKELLPSLDKKAPIVTIATVTPMALRYRDPKQRFSLDFLAVGNPANTTRLMFSRGTRLGLDVLALKDLAFAQSDGAPLVERAREAVKLHRELLAAGFKHTSYDRFEAQAGVQKLTELEQLVQHAEQVAIDPIGGKHLFVLERDELIVDVALIHQNFPAGGGRGVYALYVTIDEKVKGVE